MKRIERTAYHEAGHAVMAFIQKRAFRHVTIEPDTAEGSLGHVLFYEWSRKFNPELDKLTCRRTEILEGIIMTSLAGGLAEKIKTGRYNSIGAKEDRKNAINLANYIYSNKEELALYLKLKWLCCEHFLKERFNWNRVEVLAKALLKERRISSKKARKIIREADNELIKLLKTAPTAGPSPDTSSGPQIRPVCGRKT